MKVRPAIAALGLAAVCLGARAAPPAPVVAPSEWMASLASDYLGPGYEALARDTAALTDTLSRACSADGSAAASQARRQWKQAALALRRLSPMPFGPVLESRLLRQIDFWPTRPKQIETSIDQFAAPDARLARIGATAKGLPALEYLLFDADRVPIERDAAACAYAAWLAGEVTQSVGGAVHGWREWGASLAQTEPDEERRLLNDAVNILIGSTEVLRLKYLEKPALSSSPSPDYDAWRSTASRATIRAYFEGLRAGLLGEERALGLVVVMKGRGLLVLSARLETLVNSSTRALERLPEDLRAAGGSAKAAAAAGELLELQRFLAEDVAETLKVAVGFGESDGD